MRTEKEIEKQKQDDRAFIVSAITSELHDMAYLEYYGAWENNGGMGWFFDLCVELTDEIMFTEGSAYLKWLDHWKGTEGNNWDSFSEVTEETCFDWYHMNEARKLFKERYEKDECVKGQISERIGYMMNRLKTDEDRVEILELATKFADEQREVERKRIEEEREREENLKAKAETLVKLLKVKAIIDELKDMDVDGETMQHILEEVGMSDQMLRQLVLSSPQIDTINLLEEYKALEK